MHFGHKHHRRYFLGSGFASHFCFVCDPRCSSDVSSDFVGNSTTGPLLFSSLLGFYPKAEGRRGVREKCVGQRNWVVGLGRGRVRGGVTGEAKFAFQLVETQVTQMGSESSLTHEGPELGLGLNSSPSCIAPWYALVLINF